MAFLRKILVAFVIVIGVLLSLRGGAATGIPSLVFVISLAIVGPGNRLLWAVIFPVLAAAMSGLLYGVYLLLPQENQIPVLLLAFTSMTVAPGLLLYAATRFKKYRSFPELGAG